MFKIREPPKATVDCHDQRRSSKILHVGQAQKQISSGYEDTNMTEAKTIPNKGWGLVCDSEMFYRFGPQIVEDSKVVQCADYSLFRTSSKQSHRISLLPHQIPQVAEALKREVPEANLVVDATSHIGCSTINFTVLFRTAKVVAIECDKDAFGNLQHNLANVLPKEASRMTAVHADCVKYLLGDSLPIKSADLVSVDPAWDKLEYMESGSVMLSVSGRPIHEIAYALLDRGVAKVVMMTFPRRFAFEVFEKRARDSTFVKYPICSRRGKGLQHLSHWIGFIRKAVPKPTQQDSDAWD